MIVKTVTVLLDQSPRRMVQGLNFTNNLKILPHQDFTFGKAFADYIMGTYDNIRRGIKSVHIQTKISRCKIQMSL